MITIKIHNAREIIATEKGRLAARVGGLFIDLERKVEEEVVRQLHVVFSSKNIRAEIQIVNNDPPSPGVSYD